VISADTLTNYEVELAHGNRLLAQTQSCQTLVAQSHILVEGKASTKSFDLTSAREGVPTRGLARRHAATPRLQERRNC
jgi:hypothetical protein